MKKIRTYLTQPLHIAPLATFRVLFGGIMFVSVIRFLLNGWVDELYVQPEYFFSYYGFEWVKPFGETGMYLVFASMAVFALLLTLGLFYRLAAAGFFLSFTYVELLDQTNYLNHYYFVSIVAFLLILLPANGWFSLDVLRKPTLRRTHVPRWMVGTLRLQLGMVYFFAGLAKLNQDWLLRAMPLKIWLPAKAHLPLVGGMLKWKATAFVFSWAGALYDLTVPFFLSSRRTRIFAYAAVIGFHVMTFLLFQIGMFPFIMILCTLVFFPAEAHRRVVERVCAWRIRAFLKPQRAQSLRKEAFTPNTPDSHIHGGRSMNGFGRGLKTKLTLSILVLHFTLQLLLPLRHALYPGELFWNEEGYRFSWRVMLMEKAGYAIFHVRDPESGRKGEASPQDYLSPQQVKMMSTQPDMILQFAHFLDREYRKQGIADPEIYAEVYVTLNGSGSRLFTDPGVDLSRKQEGFHHKTWILPFEADQDRRTSMRK